MDWRFSNLETLHCPVCGSDQQELEETIGAYNTDVELTCAECENKFIAVCNVTQVTFSSKKVEG